MRLTFPKFFADSFTLYGQLVNFMCFQEIIKFKSLSCPYLVKRMIIWSKVENYHLGIRTVCNIYFSLFCEGLFFSFSDLIDNLRSTSLSDLYKNIMCRKDMHRSRFFHMPKIRHAQDSDKYLISPDFAHEAGFDAFMCGSVFISLAHIMAGLNYL